MFYHSNRKVTDTVPLLSQSERVKSVWMQHWALEPGGGRTNPPQISHVASSPVCPVFDYYNGRAKQEQDNKKRVTPWYPEATVLNCA